MRRLIFRRLMLIQLATCLAMVVVVCGCSMPQGMALGPKTDPAALGGKSLALFTLRTSNPIHPKFQPAVRTITVIAANAKKGAPFMVNPPYDQVQNVYYEYLVSLALEPGTHTVGNVAGTSSHFPFMAQFNFPVNAWFDVPPGATIYIGHVDMTNRKREKGEPRSGPVIPLVDQAASGYASGTFDVTISDRGGQDIAMFMQMYPLLQGRSITKGMMRR